MTDISVPAALLDECFKTSAACIEDIRKLYSAEPKERDGSIDWRKFSGKINLFETEKNRDYATVIESASITSLTETLQTELNAIGPHIPYWLRAYIACRRIASTIGLDDAFGFVAVAIESVRVEEGQKSIYSVLINKDKAEPLETFGKYSNGMPIRTFAKLFNKLAKYTDDGNPMASYWSVRVNANALTDGVGNGSSPEISPNKNSWLELVLGKNRSSGSHDHLIQIKFPGAPFPEAERDSVKKLVVEWCHGDPSGSLASTPNDHIRDYTSEIKKHFTKLAPTEFDGLMCTSFFWAPSKEEDGTTASIYWAFSKELQVEQIRIIQALTQILLSGVAPIARYALIDNRRRSKLLRSEQMLNLLEEPLKKLSETLEATQEHTQELRAVLYDPSYVIFSAAPRVMRYFENGAEVVIGTIRWKATHEPLKEYDARTLKLTLAAIICEIFGIMHPEPRKESELIIRAEAALRDTDQAFKHLRKTCLDIVGGEVFNGDDQNEILRERRQHACARFKQILHRPYKYSTLDYPLEPLFLSVYGIADMISAPKVVVWLNDLEWKCSALDEAMGWDRLRQKVAIGETTPAANLFPPPLAPPVPLYSHWLALLLGVIAYARSQHSDLEDARIVIKKSRMEVQLQFSSSFLDKNGWEKVRREMKRWTELRDYAFHTKGNLFKPFTDFIQRIGKIRPQCQLQDNSFKVFHSKLCTTIQMKHGSGKTVRNVFVYSCNTLSSSPTFSQRTKRAQARSSRD